MLFTGTPEEIIPQQLTDFSRSAAAECRFTIEFDFIQYWLEGRPVKKLNASYQFKLNNSAIEINFTVSDDDYPHQVLLDLKTDFSLTCSQFSLPCYGSNQPLRLQTVAIKKPWGQEIWYTGIEQRGVAKLVAVNEMAAPLPWVLAALPQHLCGEYTQALVLLKILDPLPQPVVGDLYFELHQEKREVYVVTSIDQSAWPDGVGAIRFGFDAHKVAEYEDEKSFRQAFLSAVKAYEVIRRKIDQAPNLPADDLIREEEKRLRIEMEGFTQFLPLRVGDVIKVPCLTPHSLQHGVRTVEFQTPVYERLIVSFAQQVLTQDHWDTERAVDLMSLVAEQGQNFESINCGAVSIERIVDFKDFEVRRYKLSCGQTVRLESTGEYALLMAIQGEVHLNELNLAPEQAVLIPRAWAGSSIHNTQKSDICFVVAYPK